jgi:hypothetical protein
MSDCKVSMIYNIYRSYQKLGTGIFVAAMEGTYYILSRTQKRDCISMQPGPRCALWMRLLHEKFNNSPEYSIIYGELLNIFKGMPKIYWS